MIFLAGQQGKADERLTTLLDGLVGAEGGFSKTGGGGTLDVWSHFRHRRAGRDGSGVGGVENSINARQVNQN